MGRNSFKEKAFRDKPNLLYVQEAMTLQKKYSNILYVQEVVTLQKKYSNIFALEN